MNGAIYTVAYKGKKFLNKLKFYYKSLEAKLKANTAEMTTKTDMTYEDAVQILNKLHPKKEIDETHKVLERPLFMMRLLLSLCIMRKRIWRLVLNH